MLLLLDELVDDGDGVLVWDAVTVVVGRGVGLLVPNPSVSA